MDVSQKDGGTLTTFMQAHKNGSVVLLDEVEKAHPEVLDLFLPCFGEFCCSQVNRKLITVHNSSTDLTPPLFNWVQTRATSQMPGVCGMSASKPCL
eukprot:COSAG02_NODE_58_length_43613_cov_235.901572_27_plen_96_part_00